MANINRVIRHPAETAKGIALPSINAPCSLSSYLNAFVCVVDNDPLFRSDHRKQSESSAGSHLGARLCYQDRACSVWRDEGQSNVDIKYLF